MSEFVLMHDTDVAIPARDWHNKAFIDYLANQGIDTSLIDNLDMPKGVIDLGSGYKIYPVKNVFPAYDTRYYTLSVLSVVTGDTSVTYNWKIGERDIATVKEEQCAVQDTLMCNVLVTGKSYRFPDGKTGTVQLKDICDYRNILLLGLLGSVTQLDLVTKTQFRDGENVGHDLTGVEIVAMYKEIVTYIEDKYKEYWTVKDAIRAASTIDQIKAIVG